MTPELLKQADYILDACGRRQSPPGVRWVDIPSHVGYSQFMPGGAPPFPGSEVINGVMHHGRVPFYLREMTANASPRTTEGSRWRIRLPNGKFFQSELSSHAQAFGIGSNRQSFLPEIEWKPGEKIWIDLDTIITGPPPFPGPPQGYTVFFSFGGVYRFPLTGMPPVANPLLENMPRYFVGENQNILAPEFRFAPGCPSETPAGFTDDDFWYVTPAKDLPIDGSPVNNVEMSIQPDSDFICREIWPYFPGLTNQGFGSPVVRFRRGDGYVFSSNFLPVNTIQGPVFKEFKVKARDSFYWDASLVDSGGSPGNVVTFGLYLHGVKRRKVIA